jgi:hypothetical protein
MTIGEQQETNFRGMPIVRQNFSMFSGQRKLAYEARGWLGLSLFLENWIWIV